ncbi:MAG: Fic family protein [Magnetococcales bacterium]|nr:Fic family protein [Magnetococcales bacterium]
MVPTQSKELDDLTFELVQQASTLAGRLNQTVARSVAGIVRSMNCYYSNLIEGHNTHPVDIDRALSDDYSLDQKQRDLQLEANAHIHVQALIDEYPLPYAPTSPECLKWVHREFYAHLPDSLRWVENPETGERVEIIPGAFRKKDVRVGGHIGIAPESIDRFMRRFQDVYSHGSTLDRIKAIPAAHHRLLWIHPFLDGNGRVARLMTHAILKECEVGSGLWSVSRGLARQEKRYKELLMGADMPRQGDLDGRGHLSLKQLNVFSQFMLETAIDQVVFMGELLDPAGLAERIDRYVQQNAVPKGTNRVLREVLFAGEIRRSDVANLTGLQMRHARNVVNKLLALGLLRTEGPRKPLRLGFPVDVLDDWFPKLYPMKMRSG